MKGVVQVVVHHAKPDKLRVPSRFHQPDGIRRGTGCAHRLHRTGRRGCRAAFARRSCSTGGRLRSEEHTSELQSRENLVCRLLLEKKKKKTKHYKTKKKKNNQKKNKKNK